MSDRVLLAYPFVLGSIELCVRSSCQYPPFQNAVLNHRDRRCSRSRRYSIPSLVPPANASGVQYLIMPASSFRIRRTVFVFSEQLHQALSWVVVSKRLQGAG